jgi:hypothetical protein
MTIAIAISSNDGIILATDSASTSKDGRGTAHVFHQKQKLFQLHDKHPIGLITFGLNRIGTENVATLCRELRLMLSGKLKNGEEDWSLGDKWTMKGIADRVKEYIFDKYYLPHFPKLPKEKRMGFYIGGFSSGQRSPEMVELNFDGEHVIGPIITSAKNSVNIKFSGAHEATHRLMLGYSPGLGKVMEEAGVEKEMIKKVIQLAQRKLFPPILHPHMPLLEIADVARYLVRNEKKFQHYSPEPDTVGGEIQLAIINRLDGFQWLERVGTKSSKKSEKKNAPSR